MNRRRNLYTLVCVTLLLVLGCSDQSGESGVLKNTSEASVNTERDSTVSNSDAIVMDIYKSSTCGCCGKWIDHAEQRGFSLTVHHPKNLNRLKSKYDIAREYQSCHTVVSAEGYVFEGHIPAHYIHEFLAAPPADAMGLAVPAMPAGSPGMEMGDRFESYQVLLLKRDGSAEVFADISKQEQQYR